MTTTVTTTRTFSHVVVDLDGTLLMSNSQIGESSKQILRRLSSDGVTVTIATGRSSNSSLPIVAELSLSQTHTPLICFNGSVCYMIKSAEEEEEEEDGGGGRTKREVLLMGDPLLHHPLGRDETKRVLAFAREHRLVVQYYNGLTGDVYAVVNDHKNDAETGLLQRYEELTGKKQIYVSDSDELVSAFLPAKILLLTRSDANQLLDRVRSELGHEKFAYVLGSPHPFFVEVLAASVSKGSAVQKLMEKLGVEKERVVAFGDGDNDKEMLAYAGLGVCMKNGKQTAKGDFFLFSLFSSFLLFCVCVCILICV